MRPYPPLATLITASVLRATGPRRSPLRRHALEGTRASSRAASTNIAPDAVGLLEDNFNFLTKMCTTRMRDAALSMVAAAKARGCRVAANGSDVSDHPELFLAAGADAVVLGETERTFPELVEAWGRNEAGLTGIAGLALPAARRRGPPDSDPPLRRGPRLAPAPGVGPRGRGALSGRVAEGSRPALVERRDDARLPVSLQLVREAALRNPLRPAEPGRRRRRARGPQESSPARPRLVRRRHLRPDPPLDRVVRGGGRRAGRPDPVHDAVARRSDDAVVRRRPRRRGGRGGLDGCRVGGAEDPGRHGEGDAGRAGAARHAAPPGARRRPLLVPPARLSRRNVGRPRRDARPDASGAAARHRRFGLLSASRHHVLRERPRADADADELERQRRARDALRGNLYRPLLQDRARPPPCGGARPRGPARADVRRRDRGGLAATSGGASRNSARSARSSRRRRSRARRRAPADSVRPPPGPAGLRRGRGSLRRPLRALDERRRSAARRAARAPGRLSAGRVAPRAGRRNGRGRPLSRLGRAPRPPDGRRAGDGRTDASEGRRPGARGSRRGRARRHRGAGGLRPAPRRRRGAPVRRRLLQLCGAQLRDGPRRCRPGSRAARGARRDARSSSSSARSRRGKPSRYSSGARGAPRSGASRAGPCRRASANTTSR